MGQVALGFRNVLVKAAIFFVMAAMLAWMLGGALWPRATVIPLGSVSFADASWYWQLTAGGRNRERLDWTLMTTSGPEPTAALEGETWNEIAGPFVASRHLILGGRQEDAWMLVTISDDLSRETVVVDDRFALELQMERLRNGLPLLGDDVLDSERQRLMVDPPDRIENADRNERTESS